MPLLESDNPELDLTGAFDYPPGYHGAAWVELVDEGGFAVDRPVPDPLDAFLGEVADMVTRHRDTVLGRIGCAYMRVIDGRKPENYMKWHVDPLDAANRFHTALATDDALVNLAWPHNPGLVGVKVEETDWRQAYQPGNGVVVGFTTEPHGVLPQPERPGEATAIFFATLYENRGAADLYTTNNTSTGSHAMLPTLEGSRFELPYQRVS